MDNAYAWGSMALIAAVTALIRFLPFVLFSKSGKTPKIIEKLSSLLPAAIMGMLVVYCLRSTGFSSLEGFLPALIASASVVLLHIWRRNTLLSIISGTVIYMFLVQLVF